MTVDLDVLNEAQRKAVLTTQGPLLVLAGAGSGKTRVLTYRIANLIDVLNVSPYEILAITFTNKAAVEMRSRLSQLLIKGTRGMWVSTFHAMCVRMLRLDAPLLGYTRDFTIYDDDDSKRLVKQIMEELDINPKRFTLQMIRSKISSAKNDLVSPQEFESNTNHNPQLETTARVYSILEDRLKRANAMDFDDLLVNAYLLLHDNPQVLEAYQERFKYISVDEYQDTNRVQYLLVKLLAERYRNIMVVGDDDQSIYSWRGADIRNILDFEQDYPDATTVKLEQNYRSTGNILEAANAVVAHNTRRKAKRLFTTAEQGDKIAVYLANDERDEGRFIANEIEKLHKKGRSYNDFAVFYRTNAQSRMLEDMMLRTGVPYRIVGGTRFFDRAEIRDVMAYLKLMVNPADDIAARRAINTPRRGIGDSTIEHIIDDAQRMNCTFMEATQAAIGDSTYPSRARTALNAFVQLIDELRQFSGQLRDVVEMVVEKSGLITALENTRNDDSMSRIENIREFFGVVQEYDESHEEVNDEDEEWAQAAAAISKEALRPQKDVILEESQSLVVPPSLQRLADFMAWVTLRTDLDTLLDDDSAIVLMTVHSAKGLEFPVVFIAGLEESLFPHLASTDSPGAIEEERRLAYVAITRARESLFLVHARSRSLFGSVNNNPQSRFIDEIPEQTVLFVGLGSQGFQGLGHEKRGDRRGMYGSGAASGDMYGGRVFGAGRGSRSSSIGASRSVDTGRGTTKGAKHAMQGSGSAADPRFDTARAKEIFKVGDRIDHKVFGRGTIQKIEGDALHITFDKGMTKKLALGFAPIVKIEK